MNNHQLIHQSKSNEWYTPSKYIEAAKAVMGNIDIDPASCQTANRIVGARDFYNKKSNGLNRNWFGNVWLNPPYGKQGRISNQGTWSTYLIKQYESGNVKQAILLVNAAVGTSWFSRLLDYPVCFPDKRIRFINKDGGQSSPTNGNAFFYFGNNVNRFAIEFSQFGRVMRIN